MATTDRETKVFGSIHSDPNFAVICSFISRYGSLIGLPDISFEALEKWIDDQRYLNETVKDLLLKLMKRWKSSVNEDRLPQYLIKFCHTYSEVDAFEVESCGFGRCKTSTKLRIVKALLEQQFDSNTKFKEKINEISAPELRSVPIGRDMNGKAYWFLSDNDMNIRIYCEEQDDVQNETWQIVVSDRTQLENLIAKLEELKTKPDEKCRSATPSTVVSESAKSEEGLEIVQGDMEQLVEKEELDEVKVETMGEVKLEPMTEPLEEKLKDEPPDISADRQSFEQVGKLEIKEEPETDEPSKETGIDKLQSADYKEENSAKGDAPTESRSTSCSAAEVPVSLKEETKSEHPDKDLAFCDTEAEKCTAVTSPAAKDSEQKHDGVKKDEDQDSAVMNVLPGDVGQQAPVSEPRDDVVEQAEAAEIAVACREASPPPPDEGQAPASATDLEGLSDDRGSPSATVQPTDSAHENEKSTTDSAKSRSSVKRKRVVPIGQQSSTEAESSRSESDISESASDAKSQSPAEEPPTKRKREKALKTAAERDRRLCWVKGQRSPPELKHKAPVDNVPTSSDEPGAEGSHVLPVGGKEEAENVPECADAAKETENQHGGRAAEEKATSDVAAPAEIETTKVLPSTGEENTLSNEPGEAEAVKPSAELNDGAPSTARKKTQKQRKRSRRKGRQDEKENAAEKKIEAAPEAGKKRRKKRGLRPTACQEGDVDYEPNNKLVRPETHERESKASGQDSVCISEDDIPLIELRRSTRSNKGQRKFEPLIVHEPKKRRKKDELQEEKNRKKLELEEKRLKREAELAAKNRKKRRGRNESDDEFVPGKLALRKAKGNTRGKKKEGGGSEDDSEELEEELFEPETEEESLHFSPSSSEEELESDGTVYEPKGRNAKRAAALKENSKDEVEAQDLPCSKCGLCDQPEWLLLCDRCEAGYHTACLRPPLLAIPEGDWFCPPCEHANLIHNLQEQLLEYDKKAKQNTRLIQRKERLAFVGISLSNILPMQERRPLSKYPDLYDNEEYGEETECDAEEEEEESDADGGQENESNQETEAEDADDSEDEADALPRRPAKKQQRASKPPNKDRRRWVQSSPSERSLSEDSEEENWLAGRRSQRQRKEISYKFEKFDELINEAIEDDVKDAKGAGNFGRGKDMSNITGIPRSDDENRTQGGKRKKRRRLTKLDSNDEEADDDDDDSEEYQVSEEDSSVSVEEEEDTVDADEESDDWQVGRSAVWGSSRSKKVNRRSSRSHKRSSLYNDDFVIDDYDSEDDRPYHRVRRAAARRKINYQEDSDETDTSQTRQQESKKKARKGNGIYSDGSDEDDEGFGKKRSRKTRRKSNDSDYMPSADEDLPDNASRGLSAKKLVSHKRIGSDSDDSSRKEVVSRKKGRMNNRVIESSEDDDDAQVVAKSNDSEFGEPCDRSRSGSPSRQTPKQVDLRIGEVPDLAESERDVRCAASKAEPAKTINGRRAGAALNGNSESHNNHNFSIASLLKTSNKQPVAMNMNIAEFETADLLQAGRDEDSLADTFDLVDFVTRIDPS